MKDPGPGGSGQSMENNSGERIFEGSLFLRGIFLGDFLGTWQKEDDSYSHGQKVME
jgi:hypothetical protein